MRLLGAVRTVALACAFIASSWASAAPRVGLVLDKGGKDDKSFNASAYRGIMEAKEKLGLQVKVVEASDDNSFEPLIRSFAEKEFDLIISIGIAQAQAFKKVATQFPQKKFAIVDVEVDLPNVRSIVFQEHEGSYLVGAAAAMASKTGKLGFIGGMDIPLIRRFQMGYEAGAKKINPAAKVVSNYVGVSVDAWNNPAKGKELALAQYQGGADVVFAAAGASGAGLFDAAEEKGRLAIGVDSNQNWIKPGRVLTSMMKRVDVGVFSAAEDLAKGAFTTGLRRYGLANAGVDYAVDSHNEKVLTAEMKQKLEDLKKQIIAGKIKVPDYYQERKKN